MTKSVPKLLATALPWLLGVALLAVPTPARAQWSFETYSEGNQSDINSTDWPDYLNLSRCLCDEARGSEDDAFLWVRVTYTGSSGTDEVYFYLGDDCDNDAVAISEVCYELAVINLSEFSTNEQDLPIPVSRIVDPMGDTCSEVNGGTSKLYVIVGDPTNTASATFELPYDTQAQGTPESLSADPGESAVELSWDPPTSNDENIEYYDVLCAQDGVPVSGLSSDGNADWISTEELCGQSLSVGDATTTTGTTDCDTVSGGFAAGDMPSPCFVCASVSSSTTSVRFEDLENGSTYSFAVVSVDQAGNVSEVSDVVTATPELTTDFAEAYAGDGGKEKGGFCFIATAVYGGYNTPEVQRFRHFRDGVLAHSPEGRAFIHWYYKNGRALALLKRMLPEFSLASRLGLEGLGWVTDRTTSGGGVPAPNALPFGLLALGFLAAASRRRRADGSAIDDDEKEESRW